jgi:hypothetical protein
MVVLMRTKCTVTAKKSSRRNLHRLHASEFEPNFRADVRSDDQVEESTLTMSPVVLTPTHETDVRVRVTSGRNVLRNAVNTRCAASDGAAAAAAWDGTAGRGSTPVVGKNTDVTPSRAQALIKVNLVIEIGSRDIHNNVHNHMTTTKRTPTNNNSSNSNNRK